MKFIKRYSNDTLNGQAQWFYPSGNVEQFVTFKNGKENGNAFYFYESGAIKHFRYWRDGKMVGYVTDYYDDTLATIKAVLFFDSNGHLTYRKNFDRNGNLINQEGSKTGE